MIGQLHGRYQRRAYAVNTELMCLRKSPISQWFADNSAFAQDLSIMAVERTDPTSGLEDNMGSNCDRTQVLKTCVWDRLEAPRLSSDDNKKQGALGVDAKNHESYHKKQRNVSLSPKRRDFLLMDTGC